MGIVNSLAPRSTRHAAEARGAAPVPVHSRPPPFSTGGPRFGPRDGVDAGSETS